MYLSALGRSTEIGIQFDKASCACSRCGKGGFSLFLLFFFFFFQFFNVMHFFFIISVFHFTLLYYFFFTISPSLSNTTQNHTDGLTCL